MRTATEDYVLRDKTIKAGESVLLSYPSGNRDDEAHPDRSDSMSDAHQQALGLRFGVHYCLGAMLAVWN